MQSASPIKTTPDSPARRSADTAQVLDLFIAADDEPVSQLPPAAQPTERPPCAP